MAVDLDVVTRSPATLIREAVDFRLERVHTALPGRVESYDSATKLASVLPLVYHRMMLPDGGYFEEDYPVLLDVPVCWPESGGAGMQLPLAAGDFVTLVFSEQSFDQARDVGGPASPLTARRFNLADAMAIPGSFKATLDFGGDAGFGRANGAVRVDASGNVKLGSANPLNTAASAEKVLAQLQALLVVLNAVQADVVTLFAPLVANGAPPPTSTTALATYLGAGNPASVSAPKVRVDP
jgi:hypothetical protein